MNRANSERQRGKKRGKYNLDPQRQAERSAKLADAGRRRWQNGHKERMIEAVKASHEVRWTPEERARHSERLKGVAGRKSVDHIAYSNGYRKITGIYDHALSDSDGAVYEHRKVLYDSIGPGPHLCHWGCGKTLTWEGIWVDHVDANKLNNDLGNLVPSCPGCNLARARAGNPTDWRSTGG